MTDDAAPGQAAPGRDTMDPRFDPAFQRGFEGAVTTTRRRPTAGASVLPASATRPAAAPPRVTVDSIPAPAATPTPAPAPVPASTVEAHDEEADDERRSTGSPRSTAIFVVLFVLAAALVATGAWSAQWVIEANEPNRVNETSNFALMQFAVAGAPIAIALGIAIAAGTLLVIAARRR